MRRWLPLLMLVGCGEDSPSEPRDGNRLKLRHWTYDDGTQQLDTSSFFDTKVDGLCTPRKWSDGHTYCTPDDAATVSFADPGCERPVGLAPPEAEPPHAYHRDFLFASQLLPSRMYIPTGARDPLDRVWVFDGKNCVGPFPDGGAQYFDVTQTAMSRLYENEPVGDGRVRAVIMSTDDGLQAPARLRDTALDADCEPRMRADETIACHPRDAVEAVFFREPTCTTERALAFLDNQPVPAAAKITAEDGCTTYLRVVEEVVNFPLFMRAGDACLPVELTDLERVFTVGPLELAPLATRNVAAGSRLETIELVDGTLHVPAPMLFDTVFGSDCVRLETDGVARCIPRPVSVSTAPYYTDAGCTNYTPGTRIDRRSCDPEPRFGAHAATGKLAVVELLPPLDGPLYQVVGGACVMTQVAGIRPQGKAVPLDTFAAAVLE